MNSLPRTLAAKPRQKLKLTLSGGCRSLHLKHPAVVDLVHFRFPGGLRRNFLRLLLQLLLLLLTLLLLLQDDRFGQGRDVTRPEPSGSPSLKDLKEKCVLRRIEERLGKYLDQESVLNSFQAVQVGLGVDEKAKLAEMFDVLLGSGDLPLFMLLKKRTLFSARLHGMTWQKSLISLNLGPHGLAGPEYLSMQAESK